MDFSTLIGGLQQGSAAVLPVITAIKGTNAASGATTSNQTTNASPNASSKWLLFGGVGFAVVIAIVLFLAFKRK